MWRAWASTRENSDQLQATIVWLNEAPLLPGRPYLLKLGPATVDATVTAVCVALASAALQMGGGAWPWIWGAAATAGIARAFAFVAAAAAPAVPYAGLIEQSLLWTFACGWLLAVALHRRLLTGG